MNLEALRRKRVKRMGVKSKNYTGSRRIFFVLDRGTRKFQGDLGLWMQYIEFAKKEKSYKKLGQIFSTVLRLHPTKPELWIYAAHYAMDAQADMTMARTYLQRGLRFCKRSKMLWLEYAKLEMIYIAKVAARQQVLGLDRPFEPRVSETSLDDPDADRIALPEITAEEFDHAIVKDDAVEDTALRKLAASPALTGAIPIAIFDAAMKEFDNDAALAEQFFDTFAEFEHSPPARNVLQHVMHTLHSRRPETTASAACQLRLPLIGVDSDSAEFPAALSQSLINHKESLKAYPHITTQLADRAVTFLLPFAQNKDLDEGIHRALVACIRQSMMRLGDASGSGDHTIDIIRRLADGGRIEDARLLTSHAIKCWPSDQRLQTLQIAV